MKHLFPYKVFLLEGLSKEQEEKFLKDWDQDRLEDWFGKKNHRLYFKLLKKVKKGDVEEFRGDVESQVEEYLMKTYHGQYTLDDYRKGYALDTKNKNRQVRLGKVIKDPKLLQAFNDDATRAGHRMETKDPIICLSKHPLDIAAMSTGRGWKSCKELPNESRPEGGKHYDKLDYEVKVLLIAYLIYPNDRNVETPIARILLLPYYNSKGQTYYKLARKHYGEPGGLEENFYATLGAWLDEKQKDLKSVRDKFTLDSKIYPDNEPAVIHLGISPLEEILDKIVDGEYEIVDGKINVKGNVYFYRQPPKYKSILELCQFGKVTGTFVCYKMNIHTLEGAPEEVGGEFDCSYNNLRSLKHAPKKVGGRFDCANNYITSLKGAPEEVGGSFECSNNNLKSLKGAPEEVNGNFKCSNNILDSLEGGPKKVRWSFNCSRNDITSLKGAPEEVGMGFDCSDNKLPSLEGGPQKVGKDFDCFSNKLESLEGAPEKVGGDFNCSNNKLRSLEGKPKIIGGGFFYDDNPLEPEDERLQLN